MNTRGRSTARFRGSTAFIGIDWVNPGEIASCFFINGLVWDKQLESEGILYTDQKQLCIHQKPWGHGYLSWVNHSMKDRCGLGFGQCDGEYVKGIQGMQREL